MMYGQKNINF